MTCARCGNENAAAAAGFVTTIGQVRANGDQLTSADLGLIFGESMPGRPEAVAPLRAARDLYAKVGARPLLARAETALRARPATAETAGSAVAGEAL